MTPLEQLVYQAVIGNAGITGLLNVDSDGNIAFYDKQLPQQNVTASGALCYPAGVFQRISSPRLFIIQQTSTQAGVGRARFQFTFWGYDSEILEQIDIALLAMFRTFDAYNGPQSPPTVIQPGFISYSSRALTEPQTQPVLQKVVIDVIFWFQDQ
jgi:hypothetical protein